LSPSSKSRKRSAIWFHRRPATPRTSWCQN
jgi:hypothetical protein